MEQPVAQRAGFLGGGGGGRSGKKKKASFNVTGRRGGMGVNSHHRRILPLRLSGLRAAGKQEGGGGPFHFSNNSILLSQGTARVRVRTVRGGGCFSAWSLRVNRFVGARGNASEELLLLLTSASRFQPESCCSPLGCWDQQL